MALSITVNGAGTFTASMEEGPVSFTASLAAVGPAGPAGATGPAGVVAASAPILYNSGTQTISIDDNPSFTTVSAIDQAVGTTMNNLGILFPDATQQVTAFVGESRKEYIIARNNTGSTIAKGKVVYLSGATGNKPTMALAQADSEATSARTIGILVEQTANNADGKVIVSGAAENIDTSAFNDGDTLYLSASTAGGMTTTLPTQPLHGVVIGIVTRANPSVGSVEVAINNYQELEELSDVLISGEANNDLLAWDSTASVWKNRTFSALGLLTSSTAASTYLSKAGNLSGLADLPTSRTNLGLGAEDSVSFAQINYSSATAPSLRYGILPNDVWAGVYDGIDITRTRLSNLGVTFPDTTVQATKGLLPANNLSDLASASTARTNLGLGTMAVETASNYLTTATASSTYAPLASPALTGTPTAPSASATTDTTQIATTAFTQDAIDTLRVDIQTFGGPSSSGNFTWTKPAGAKFIEVRMIGAGGGGASGTNTITANARGGGGGGGPGAAFYARMPASEFGATVAVVVGAGGAGGAGSGPSVQGSGNGSNGGDTTFGNYRVTGGNRALGNTGGVAATGSVLNLLTATTAGGGNGITGNGNAGGNITTGIIMPTGGGGGAGATGGSTLPANGGNGGARSNTVTPGAYTASLAGGVGGVASTDTVPTAGTNGDILFAGGTGGGGGYYKTATAGVAGATGGWPGGGGGGGGACDNDGVRLSGAGGSGANGMVTVITYF